MIGKVYNNKEYYVIVKDILRNSEFQRRKDFKHHNDSVYDHSIQVSIVTYKIACHLSRHIPISVEDATIGALLHDFYLTPWRDNKDKGLRNMHGFSHANIAYVNASNIFPKYMNNKTKDIIKKHMFPLNIVPPRYIESWIVTFADKVVSLNVFTKPSELPKYVRISLPLVKEYPKSLYKFTKKFVANMY